MSDVVCKHCKVRVAPGTEHHCDEMRRAGLPPMTAPTKPDQDDDGCFVTSAVVGYATGDSQAGTIIGGNLVGAIAGAALSPDRDDDGSEASNDAEPDPEPETSDDSDDGDDSDDTDDDD